MHDFARKPKNWVAVCVVAAFLFGLIYSFLSATNANLPSYVSPPATAAVTESKRPDIETTEYRNEKVGFSMEVPLGWAQVTQKGNQAFINQKDAASIQFAVSEYLPTLNGITEETVTVDVKNAGGVFGGFAQLDVSSYLSIYELDTVDYFEFTTWDLDTTVRVTMQIPAAKYQDYYDIAVYLLDTFRWEKPNPLPDGFHLFYSDFGNFELGVPTGWSERIESGSYIATAPNTGSFITGSVTETDMDISAMTQLDYTNIISPSKSGFLLSMFSSTGSSLTVEASYTNNGTPWRYVHYLYSSGQYLYEFSMDCPQEAYSADGAKFLTAVTLFRLF